MNRLTEIDISSVYYSVIHNCNKEDDPRRDDFSYYKQSFDAYIESILINTKATHYLMFGDGYTSFRKKAFTEFKGDRKSKPIPKFINDLKNYGRDKWNVITSNILEADDLCLIHTNEIIGFDKIIIASIDSDLRQEEGIFYNYGYKRSNLSLEEAFEVINKEQSRRNLWKQVMIKGHNNKTSFLKGCGKVSAEKYLKPYSINQLKLAALNAFILGIDKKIHDVPRNIKGYGLLKGIDEFSKAFIQSYLLRTIEEALEYDPEFSLYLPNKIVVEEPLNNDILII